MQHAQYEPNEVRRRAVFIVEDVLETNDPTDMIPELKSTAALLAEAAALIPWSQKGVTAARRLSRAMIGLTDRNARNGTARHEAVAACRAVYLTMPALFPVVRKKTRIEKAQA